MKAILVLDEMPKDCPMCPLSNWNSLNQFTGCRIVKGKLYAMTDDKGYAESNTRPSWCPLKEMPQKETGEKWVYRYGEPWYKVEYLTEWEEGWNACLEEINK